MSASWAVDGGSPAAGGYAELAVVRRSGFVESRHFGSVVGLAADGGVAVTLGRPDAAVLGRSTLKPIQALGCLLAGAPLEGAALAIAAGSHTGEDDHVAVVQAMLVAAGVSEAALACPADHPEDRATRDRLICGGVTPSPIRMNCSGKHAAMLAACRANGWPIDDYLHHAHPLQRLVRATLAEAAGESIAHTAVDGCGAPVFAVSLSGLARAARALVVAEPGTPRRRVADAMRQHPFFVGGSGHANTEVMRLVPGVVCKGGAEGVLIAAAASGVAVAVKVIDGSPRATTLLALAVLRALGVDTSGAHALEVVDILGGAVSVGRLEPTAELRAALGTPVGT